MGLIRQDFGELKIRRASCFVAAKTTSRTAKTKHPLTPSHTAFSAKPASLTSRVHVSHTPRRSHSLRRARAVLFLTRTPRASCASPGSRSRCGKSRNGGACRWMLFQSDYVGARSEKHEAFRATNGAKAARNGATLALLLVLF